MPPRTSYRADCGFTIAVTQRAYALGCEALDLAPSEIVFVDDQPRNVEGARRVGLDALQFDVTRPGSSFAEVERRLGLNDGGS